MTQKTDLLTRRFRLVAFVVLAGLSVGLFAFPSSAASTTSSGRACVEAEMRRAKARLVDMGEGIGRVPAEIGEVKLIASGRLNSDRIDDVVGVYLVGGWARGNGYSEGLVACVSSGRRFKVAAVMKDDLIVNVRSLSLNGGTIEVVGKSYGSNDPRCCPTIDYGWYLSLSGNRFVVQNAA